MDNMLFRNRFLAIFERDGYTFMHEVRCNGVIVSLLPFRFAPDGKRVEYLARLEVCPAHGSELELCSITGGLEPGVTVAETACEELWEEAGYRAETSELIDLGTVRPSKASNTIVHLFAVDASEKLQSTPPTDGSRFEIGSSVEWVGHERGVQISDPLFVTAIARLQLSKQKGD